jgi:hypothetical protein
MCSKALAQLLQPHRMHLLREAIMQRLFQVWVDWSRCVAVPY